MNGWPGSAGAAVLLDPARSAPAHLARLVSPQRGVAGCVNALSRVGEFRLGDTRRTRIQFPSTPCRSTLRRAWATSVACFPERKHDA